jgi:hypothetical protein
MIVLKIAPLAKRKPKSTSHKIYLKKLAKLN